MVMMLAVSFSFAQVKAVKEAKSIANGGKDFAQAETLINGALQNAETKDQAETWNVAGFIQQKRALKENEKAWLRQPYDTLQLYNSILQMYNYYLKCDELAQQPDAKGKVKNKYRKANSASLMTDRGNLLNGGIQYFNSAMGKEGEAAIAENKKALEFFKHYVDIVDHPMMETQREILKADTLTSLVGFYAAWAASKVEDWPNVLKYAPVADGNKEVGMNAAELLCTAYKAMGDTARWVVALQEGLKKYPQSQSFFANLIDYYTNSGKFADAIAFAEGMLAQEPNNALFLYVMGYLYQSTKEYEKAIQYYEKAIAADPQQANAYSNLGLLYCQQAEEFSATSTSDVNDPKYNEDQVKLRSYYEKAKPLYEKARELKPDQTDLWMQGLYRVYYLLNMANELQEIETLMKFQ